LVISQIISHHYTTHFPNDLYNISGSTITKHIFLYGTMIGTVKGPVGSGVLYFDHTDHLSGANVTSDIKGKISEVTDYLPYGAIRAHEQFWGFNEQRKYAGSIMLLIFDKSYILALK